MAEKNFKTSPLAFMSANPAGTKLFSVNPGIDAEDALNICLCFIDEAKDIATRAAENGAENCWAAQYMLQMCEALITSVMSGLPDDSPSEGERP